MSADSPANTLPLRAARQNAVRWRASEGQVMNLALYVACVLTSWLVLPLLYALYRLLLAYAHVYLLTDERLLETTGLIFKDTEALELYRVKDIRIQQPPLQRLFGRGTVVLVTSDRSTPNINLSGIQEPDAVAALLRELVERCRVAKGVREID
jgi:membrane protein YdbS with pleckstrin-like domain